MAGSRAVRISAREQRERDARRERRIVFAAAGVLLAALLVVVVGLVITQYLPPRARVGTVGAESVSAQALVDRAALISILEPAVQAPPIDEFAAFALERLADEAALRSGGAAAFGAPTDHQRAAEMRALLGLPAEADEASLAQALADLLWSPDSVRTFEALVDARIQEAALRARFEQELPEAAPQLRLRRIRVGDEARASELRGRALAGEPFSALADEASVEALSLPGGDLGWMLLDAVDAAVAGAVATLELGEVTEPLAVGPFVELYLLEERAERRALEPGQVAELVGERLAAWLASERAAIGFENDLSPGEAAWVTERFVRRLADHAGRP
ncbi:MAG: peptidylprolyl isomerase [Chloroflexi bacterium]|nr:peptidylprolyl isomerase [Chloroflexota bacterium]